MKEGKRNKEEKWKADKRQTIRGKKRKSVKRNTPQHRRQEMRAGNEGEEEAKKRKGKQRK